MKKAFYLSNGTYKNGVIVTLGLSYEEMLDYLDYIGCMPAFNEDQMYSFKRSFLNNGAIATTYDLENGWSYICIKKYDKDLGTLFIAALCHECLHACEYLFERIRLPHTQDSSEAWTYQLENYVYNILEAIKSSDTNWSKVKKLVKGR